MKAFVIGALLTLLFAGCVKVYVEKEVEEVIEEWNVCLPARGEDQAPQRQARGKAFNSVEHHCI
jgi:hypothetical protein